MWSQKFKTFFSYENSLNLQSPEIPSLSTALENRKLNTAKFKGCGQNDYQRTELVKRQWRS